MSRVWIMDDSSRTWRCIDLANILAISEPLCSNYPFKGVVQFQKETLCLLLENTASNQIIALRMRQKQKK